MTEREGIEHVWPAPVQENGDPKVCRTCTYWQRNPTVPTMWCYHPRHGFKTEAEDYCNSPCRWDSLDD